MGVSLREKGVDLNTSDDPSPKGKRVSLREKGVDLNANKAAADAYAAEVSLREKGVDLNINTMLDYALEQGLPS